MKTNIRKLDSLTHNDTAATKLINDNFNALQQGIEDSLSRTGKTPNFMDAELDMNKNRIINLGEPVDDSDLATKKYVDDTVATEETRARAAEDVLSDAIAAERARALLAEQGLAQDVSDEETRAKAAERAITDTLGTYGNIVTHDVNEFATAVQGAKADTAVQPGDLPTVNNATITLTQGGVAKGSFTTNQGSNASIELDAGGSGETGAKAFDIMTGYVSVLDGTYYVDIDVTSEFEQSDERHYLYYVSLTTTSVINLMDYVKPFGSCLDIDLNTDTYSRIVRLFVTRDITEKEHYNATRWRVWIVAIPISSDVDAKDAGGVIVKTRNEFDDARMNYMYNAHQINELIPTKTSELTNDSGFITSSSIPTNYVTTDTQQTVTSIKYFREKNLRIKQTDMNNAPGLAFYGWTSGGTEVGSVEYLPNKINSLPLLSLNTDYSSAYVGFRYYNQAVNIVAPKVVTAGTYFIPVNVTDGTTTVTANGEGTLNIGSLIPTIVTSVSSSSTNSETVGAKLFYDTCGDIETLINAL